MPRQTNDQIPLGELLAKARVERGLSRAQLAKETGVSENSIVRYEKAGIERDGQYPPSPKLAALCFSLDISPVLALFGCLNYGDFWKFKGETWDRDLVNHPDYNWLSDEYMAVLRQNRILRSYLSMSLKNHEELTDFEQEILESLGQKVARIFEREEQLDQEADDLGMFEQRYSAILTPGVPRERRAQLGLRPLPNKPKPSSDENGPDHSDPDRSQNSTNNSEAVGAAPIDQNGDDP